MMPLAALYWSTKGAENGGMNPEHYTNNNIMLYVDHHVHLQAVCQIVVQRLTADCNQLQ